MEALLAKYGSLNNNTGKEKKRKKKKKKENEKKKWVGTTHGGGEQKQAIKEKYAPQASKASSLLHVTRTPYNRKYAIKLYSFLSNYALSVRMSVQKLWHGGRGDSDAAAVLIYGSRIRQDDWRRYVTEVGQMVIESALYRVSTLATTLRKRTKWTVERLIDNDRVSALVADLVRTEFLGTQRAMSTQQQNDIVKQQTNAMRRLRFVLQRDTD